jgi:hypothetical protein
MAKLSESEFDIPSTLWMAPQAGFSPEGEFVGFLLVDRLVLPDTRTGITRNFGFYTKVQCDYEVDSPWSGAAFAVGPNGRIALGYNDSITCIKGRFDLDAPVDILYLNHRPDAFRLYYTQSGRDCFTAYFRN